MSMKWRELAEWSGGNYYLALAQTRLIFQNLVNANYIRLVSNRSLSNKRFMKLFWGIYDHFQKNFALMSCVSHQSIEYYRILESRIVEYCVIFVYFLFFNSSKPVLTENIFLCWVLTNKKFTYSLKSKEKKYYVIFDKFEVPKFENTQLIDEIHTT